MNYAITASEIQHSAIFSSNTEWARLDPEGKLVHLDMDLCRKGPSNAYTQLAIGVWDAAVKDRDAVLRQALEAMEEMMYATTDKAADMGEKAMLKIKEVLNEPTKP
jgi:hypothetical protein